MENKFNTYIRFGMLMLICYSILSCKKFILVDPPKNELVSSTVFSDSSDATAAVLGLYIKIMNTSTELNLANGGLTVFTGLSSDELNTIGEPADLEFLTNSVSPTTNSKNDNLWSFGYQLIYHANACLEGISHNSKLSPSLVSQLSGEIKVLRAFIYMNLANVYGDVPLITTTNYHINSKTPRSSKDLVYEKIIEDLISAESSLSAEYVNSNKTRPNKLTASALLAKVYLHRQQWDNAIQKSSQVISDGRYILETNPSDVFKVGNKEAIWQLSPLQAGRETAEGNFFIPYDNLSVPKYIVTDTLLQAFEPGDYRKTEWLHYNVINGDTLWYPFKYKLVYNTTGTPQEHYAIIRLADLYLIRSEAECQKNNLAAARDDLNKIRMRGGLSLNTDVLQPSLQSAIQQERRIELFCEGGNRWFDLKRTGKADNVLSPVKGSDWQSTDVLFPIPFKELSLNPFLVQNPGY